MSFTTLPFKINPAAPYLPHKLRPGKKEEKTYRDLEQFSKKEQIKIYHRNQKWCSSNTNLNTIDFGFNTQMPCPLPTTPETGDVNTDQIHKNIEKLFAEAVSEKQDSISLSLGLNSIKSLSRKENKKKKRWMAQQSKFNSKVTMGLTFFDPAWTIDHEKYDTFIKSDLFKSFPPPFNKQIQDKNLSAYQRAKACYEGLYAINKTDLATKLLEHEHTTKCQYNYQAYREVIRLWNKTHLQVKELKKMGPKAVYAHIADPDTQSYKTESDVGIYDAFSSYLENLKKKYPILYTGGYKASETEPVFYHHAVNLDMLARRSITKCLPLGAYYPEPNLFILIPASKSHISGSFNNDLSAGKNFESRRLITSIKQYGAQKKRIAKDSQFGTLSIATDLNRFKSLSTEKQSKKLNKDPHHFITKECLKALRGFAQSHLNPRDLCANLALSIPKSKLKCTPKGYRQKLTGLLSQIMNKIDPISLILSGITTKFYNSKYTSNQGKQFIKDYPVFIKEYLHRAGLTNKVVNTSHWSESQHEIIQTLSKELRDAIDNCTEFFDSKLKKQLVHALISTSLEIYEYLKTEIEKETISK